MKGGRHGSWKFVRQGCVCLLCNELDGRNPHGTRGRYSAGCKCGDCMRAAAEYRAGYRPERTRLDVTCWCEARVVRVPREVVMAGGTGSCGAAECSGVAA